MYGIIKGIRQNPRSVQQQLYQDVQDCSVAKCGQSKSKRDLPALEVKSQRPTLEKVRMNNLGNNDGTSEYATFITN
jgi:hypothetical protein